MNKKLLLRVGCPILFFAVCGVVLYPVFDRARGPREGRPVCRTNLKQIGLAVAQYLQDYSGKYPPVMARGEAFGWAGVLQPYLKDPHLLRCPELDSGNRMDVKPSFVGYTDYWYNGRLAGIWEGDLAATALTIIFGDGNNGHDDTTARYSLSDLPSEWLADKSSPAYRHLGGANYAFADGHVKWLTPEKIEPTMKNGGPTFAFR